MKSSSWIRLALAILPFGNSHAVRAEEPLATHLEFAVAAVESGRDWEAGHSKLLSLISGNDAETSVASAALAALAVHGDERSVGPIFDLAENPKSPLRQQAVNVLATMNGRNAARRIKARLARLPSAEQAELSAALARSDLADLPPLDPDAGDSLLPDAYCADASSAPTRLRFERLKLSDRAFEAASAADVDRDGHIDIISGGFWYPGPRFRESRKICDVQPSGEYFDDFSDYPMDVNGDDYPDVITGGFFGGPLRWRENPRGRLVDWKEHPIAHVGSIETTRFWDVDGDGFPEICPNASGNIRVFRLTRDERGKGVGEYTSWTVRQGGVGHGLGFGDINGDGRGDFVGPDGWYEAPENPMGGKEWVYRREFALGSASVPILVHDVNGDKRNDLIVGQGHGYGLHWLEQTAAADGTRGWTRRTIDPDRSQFHEMRLADLDGDGDAELVTGKRWRAHNDNDPGAHDPLGLYYYEINGGRFDRVTLNYGPGAGNSGTGIYLWAEDVDKDGRKDIVAPGKDGLFLFRNLGPVAIVREPK